MVTSSLQPKSIKQNLEIAKQLIEQGQLDEAIATYQKLIELEPNRLSFYVQLARVQEEKGDLEGAIVSYTKVLELKPDNSKIYAKLAKLYLEVAKKFRKQEQLDEAIDTYQKAIELQPNRLSPYINLAKVQEEKGDLEGAIDSYLKVLELDSNNYNAYLRLADLYLKMGQVHLDLVIESYQKAIQIKPDLPFKVYNNLSLALKQQGRNEEANDCLKSAPTIEDGETYLKIWNLLNQNDLINLEEKKHDIPEEIELKKMRQYFEQTSQYKIIDLSSINEEEKQLIKDAGFSLDYLNGNKTEITTETRNISQEYVKKITNFNLTKQHTVPPRVAEVFQQTKFQFSMVEDGYIYAVCPSTGKILSSNRSLVPEAGYYIFYRFVGSEVFYLVTGRAESGFLKFCLYFPKKEIVISLYGFSVTRPKIFNDFKRYIVKNWKLVVSYLTNSKKIKKVALITFDHFAHHLWNELSGIYKLHEANYLDKIDTFLITAEPLGQIDRIFFEIPKNKIKRIHKKELSAEVLNNNYFCIRLGWNFIKEDLANRIYQTSLEYCSSDFLENVKEVRQKHFPLLWISIRLYNRTWISQVQSISNIINKLSESFPNLGVVIDGFSLVYNFSKNASFQEIIQKQNDTVEQIKSLIPESIKIYNTVGCMLYESIIWAYAIDYYLAHHGTIQHKVGWTANKPGLVHTNQQTLKKSVLKLSSSWAREKGVLPTYIPKECVIDITDNVRKSLNENRVNLNNYDCDWQVIYEKVFNFVLALKNEKSELYFNEANQLKKKRKINLAIEQYSQVLTIDPDCVPALSQLATIYEKKKEFDRALTYYQRITKLKPEQYQAQIGLAQIMKSQGNLEEAKASYKKALHSQLTAGLINRTTILQKLIDKKQAKTYLEIGVCTGSNFLQIQAEKKIAVDPKFQIPDGYISDENDRYYEMTSDVFFADRSDSLKKYGLDLVLVDGLHTYEQSLKDVLNSLEFLNNGGIIVLHDCHPTSEAAGHPIASEAKKMSSWTGAWMGDVWKTIVYLRSLKSDLNVFVLNCDCGVGIVTKGTPENMLKYSAEEIANLTYEDFQANKVKLLNLKKANYFDSFLANMSI